MKKLLSILLSAVMLMSICAMPIMAEEAVVMGQVQPKDIITITVDGKYVDCSVYGQMPVIVEGRTLVPLRSVFEALGATVEWNNEQRSAVSVKGDVTVTLAIDSKELVVNGSVKTLDVPAQIMNERTMVPVRAVAEAFGCKVDWNNDTRTVVIVTEPTEVAENTPEAVVKSAMDAMLALDFEKAAQYCENPEAIMAELGYSDISSVVDMLAESYGYEITEEQADLVEKFIGEILTLMSYEVGESAVSGDSAVVKVTISAPDLENVEAAEYIDQEAIMLMFVTILAENGYTMENIMTITDEAEQEKLGAIIIEGMFDYIIEIIREAAKDAPVITETMDISLKKVNGNWVILE